jgi:hypothetical protein
MNDNDKQYVKVASIAAFILAFTTLGVHFISFPAETFEERALLYKNPLYHFRNGLLIFHCLLAMISLYGFVVVKRASHFAPVGIGMIFFSFFSFTEIFRMMYNSWYANGLRQRYLEATDKSVKLLLKHDLELWGLSSNSLFLVFILCFAMGNLFYGFALYKDQLVFSRWLGYGFFLWSLLTFLALGNDFWENENVGWVVDMNNKYYQPAIRSMVGVWLWRKAVAI